MSKTTKINVSNHAVEQFQKRMFHQELTEEEIRHRLATVARRGSVVNKRPGHAIEVRFEGLSIVLKREGDVATVITFLGDKRYRKWAHWQEIKPRYIARAAG